MTTDLSVRHLVSSEALGRSGTPMPDAAFLLPVDLPPVVADLVSTLALLVAERHAPGGQP